MNTEEFPNMFKLNSLKIKLVYTIIVLQHKF